MPSQLTLDFSSLTVPAGRGALCSVHLAWRAPPSPGTWPWGGGIPGGTSGGGDGRLGRGHGARHWLGPAWGRWLRRAVSCRRPPPPQPLPPGVLVAPPGPPTRPAQPGPLSTPPTPGYH